MGDPLIDLEERLEQLVPRGLSGDTSARLESKIDQLAESADLPQSSRRWHGAAIAAAACIAVSLGAVWTQRNSETSDAVAKAPVEVESPIMEYLGSQIYVTEMTDDGWDLAEGAEQPVRYWISMVTETEELLDNESGYQVQVVSEREMVEPVLLTHL